MKNVFLSYRFQSIRYNAIKIIYLISSCIYYIFTMQKLIAIQVFIIIYDLSSLSIKNNLWKQNMTHETRFDVIINDIIIKLRLSIFCI